MKILKPSWVTHDGNPIFSIDIHPDGSRFATGGQGDNCGKVVLWNMAPVRSEKDENNENVPKMLCAMDNHLACVNCVRFSNNGKFLASGGDDKIIMIWQLSRYGGGSSSFGSDVVNVESWRCVSTLSGHNGDVLDLSWSAHDAWLATCSVDNTIIVWNANKFPEQIKVLRGHTGMVKGVTWDPVGKYLASQSDDKSVKVWRTVDWQQETSVTKPFEECGGTTHVLRLGWSPDGHYLVSAHAMNNSGPTAQIIEREGWKLNMDFVGHRKAVTCVRFNPKILEKNIKKNSSEKLHMCSCCAIGSRDRSLSIWLTVLKRPLVVTHDLFQNSIMDISWTQTGMELLCCSWDGSVAYLKFCKEELGNPLTEEEKIRMHQRIYGKSLVSNSVSNPVNQIIETPAMMKLQQQKQEEKLEATKPANPFQPPEVTPTKKTNGHAVAMMNGTRTPAKADKQIETKTKDGKRRITPIFLAPQPAFGESPPALNTSLSNEPVFTTSTKQSSIVVEKKDRDSPPVTGKQLDRINALLDTSPIQAMSSGESRSGEKAKSNKEFKEKDKDREKDTLKIKSVKRKAETPAGESTLVVKRKPGRPKKDKAAESSYISTPVAIPPAQQAIEREPAKIIYKTAGLNLPVPSIDRTVSILISGTVGTETSVVLELENLISAGLTSLNKVTCIRGGQHSWEALLTSKIIAAAGNSHVSCLACNDHSIHILSSSSGRRILPTLVLDSKISIFKCSKHTVMAITSKGYLFVWNTQSQSAVIRNESLIGIIPSSETSIQRSILTEDGVPILTLSNGRSYTFKAELGCWVMLASKDDTLFLCSDHKGCMPTGSEYGSSLGVLATLQNYKHKAGSQAAQLFRTNHILQQPSTLSHLENQVASAIALQSASEYRFWLITYVRFLVQEGIEVKLRAICDDLLGPVFKSKSHPKWENKILGLNKHKLLEEILPLVGANLQLQRFFTEFHEQLESVKT